MAELKDVASIMEGSKDNAVFVGEDLNLASRLIEAGIINSDYYKTRGFTGRHCTEQELSDLINERAKEYIV